MNDKPLPEDIRQYITRKVAAGEFASKDEVLEAAVRIMRAMEGGLRRDVLHGLAEAEAGHFSDLTVDDILAGERINVRGR